MMRSTSDRLTSDGLARFGEIARSQIGDNSVPGVVALVGRGDQVHVAAHGSLSIGGPRVQRDSLFRISATTKPITGAATLALVREGLLDIDEPVDRLLPELADRRVLRRMDGPLDDTIPAARAITLRDLLTFTFGFGAVMEMYMATEDWPIVVAESELPLATIGPPDPEKQPDPDAWIAALGSLPLITQPGERWLYNTSASVLGVLLSRAAGAPISEVYRTRLFEPLGMQDTAFSRLTRRGSRPHTATRRKVCRSGTRPKANGASRPSSATPQQGWSPPSTTCGRSRGCSCAEGNPS
jgi:CubicO group peptidase (beta-lactamase class C family)